MSRENDRNLKDKIKLLGTKFVNLSKVIMDLLEVKKASTQSSRGTSFTGLLLIGGSCGFKWVELGLLAKAFWCGFGLPNLSRVGFIEERPKYCNLDSKKVFFSSHLLGITSDLDERRWVGIDECGINLYKKISILIGSLLM